MSIRLLFIVFPFTDLHNFVDAVEDISDWIRNLFTSVPLILIHNLNRPTLQNTVLPNFVIVWLTLLLRIREVPVSNLVPKTGHPDLGLSWFSQSLQENDRILP
jgi:hypothetical protein